MHIAVLGAGPSGMMAAHAAVQLGHFVTIYDKDADKARRNSGVYFLHSDCDLLLDRVEIKQTVIGKYLPPLEVARLYSQKVYGKEIPSVSVSDVLQHETIFGFNANQAIVRLWDLYGDFVRKYFVKNIGDVYEIVHEYDAVISTIPAKILFPELNFESVKIFVKVGKSPLDDNFSIYNVNPYFDWYRCSGIFGIFTQEYGYGKQPQFANDYEIKQVIKVVKSDPLPVIDNLLFTGRYGAWDKKFLTHNVYFHVLKWLQNNG